MRLSIPLLAIVAACSTFAARSFAVPILISPGPSQDVSGRHASNLTFDFTPLDAKDLAMRIASLQDPPTLTYFGTQDPHDIAGNLLETGDTSGVGTVLQGFSSMDPMGNPSDMGTEQFSVNLFDPQEPLYPDHDYGTWYLKPIVTVQKNVDNSVSASDFFTAHVDVLETGFSSSIPEPASMLLIGGGLIGLGLLRLRRRGDGMPNCGRH